MPNLLDCTCFLFSKDHQQHCSLWKLWDVCLKESLDAETRSRIFGGKAQMKTMSAVSGQHLASLAPKTIQSMRNNSDFDLFYQTVSKKAEQFDNLNKPVLPRERHQSNYSILQFVSGHEENSDATEPYYPPTVKEHFKAIYFETIDAVHKALKQRFEKPSFIVFSNVEQVLLKSINSKSYQKEYDDFVLVYADDVETSVTQ